MKVRTRAPTSRAGKAVDAFLCLRARGDRKDRYRSDDDAPALG
jgi:hypothetical protein